MFDLKRTIECPKCGQFVEVSRKICPYCNIVLVSDSSNNSIEIFDSSSRGIRSDTFGGSFGRQNAVVPKDETFSSFGRIAANAGYTQQSGAQRMNDRPEFESAIGAGISHDPNDTEYFSSRTRIANLPEMKRVVDPSRYEDEYYSRKSTEERMLERKIAEASTNSSAHDAEDNPYENAEKYRVVNPTAKQEENSTEYIANTLEEFTHHRFAKDTVDRIEIILTAFVLSSAVTLWCDFFFDPAKLTWVFTAVFIVAAWILAIVSVKLYSKKTSMFLAIVTMVYSVIMVFFLHKLSYRATALELWILFVPIILMNICDLHLIRKISELYVKWDTYQRRGELLVNVDFSTDDIKIFKTFKQMAEHIQSIARSGK